MSDNTLSQEEIEALLSGSFGNDDNDDAKKIVIEDYLSEIEQDTLGEIGNISFGNSATALSTLLGQGVNITTPTISLIRRSELDDEFVLPYVAIKVEYTVGLHGMNLFVIKQSDAAIIADLMLGGDGKEPNEDLGEIHLSAVQEAMNQMMGSAATSMSTIFDKKVDISPPSIALLDIQEEEGTEQIPNAELLIKIAFSLKVGDLIDSEIMQIFPLEFGKKAAAALFDGSSSAEEALTVMEKEVQAVEHEDKQEQQQMQQEVSNESRQHHAPQQKQAKKPQVQVQQAQFASFESTPLTSSESQNLDLLLDIPLQVTVELGRTKRSVKEILEMSSGSIIELDKLAGEPVDILVNNRLIANGEVVVIDENFGVRITDILSQKERLNNLKD